MVLEEIKSKLLASSETEEDLFVQVINGYEQATSTEKKSLENMLSELHNTGKINLIERVKLIDRNSNFYHDFFIALNIFNGVLPSLDACVEDVLQSLVHLKQQYGDDLVNYDVYRSFERYCQADSKRPIDCIEFILEQNEFNKYASFITISIKVLTSNHLIESLQIIEKLIENSNEMVRTQAYISLGELVVDKTQANVIWELLCSSASSENESDCCASILRATFNFGERFPSYWSQIEKCLPTFIKGPSQEVFCAISNIVWSRRVELPEDILAILLDILNKWIANVPLENKKIVENIDLLFFKLSEDYVSEFVLNLLELILILGVSFRQLKKFSRILLSKHYESVNIIVTKWFLSDETKLYLGVSDLLEGVKNRDIELKAVMSLLDDEIKQVFVSYKAVGWLFDRPIAAASLILSICEIAPPTACKQFEQLLYEPLLLNYPEKLKEFFQSCIDKDFQADLCQRLLNKLEGYRTDIKKVCGIKELKASSEDINAYSKTVSKEILGSYEQAFKSSILDLIPIEITLYGNSSIVYVEHDGEKVRQEMQLQTYSTSLVEPRLNVLDPFQLEYTLNLYRYWDMKK